MPDEVAAPSTRYKGYSKAFDMVTPYDIRRARKDAQNGRPGRLYAVLDFFKRNDDAVISAMGSLDGAVMEEPPQVEVPGDEEDEEALQQRRVIDRLFQEIEIDEVVETLIDGHYYGIKAIDPQWGTLTIDGATYQAPTRWEEVPMSWLHARTTSARTTGTQSILSSSDDNKVLHVGNAPYTEYDDEDLLLYVDGTIPDKEDVDFEAFGRGIGAARMGVFSYFNMQDWAAANEAFGTPAVIGKLLEGWDDDDKELLKEAVHNLTGDLRGVMTDRGEINLVERKVGSGDSFEKLRQAAKKATAIIIKSESLTDHMGDAGSHAAMKTTNGVRVDVASRIARVIQKGINKSIVYPVLDKNFGRRLVKAHLPVKGRKNLMLWVRIFEKLWRMDMPLSISEIREKIGIRPPQDEDDTLQRRAGGTNPFTDPV